MSLEDWIILGYLVLVATIITVGIIGIKKAPETEKTANRFALTLIVLIVLGVGIVTWGLLGN